MHEVRDVITSGYEEVVTDTDSTLVDVTTVAENRRSFIGRRVALSLLALVVLLGATGLLGVHAGTATGGSADYRLTVTYPHVARSGLDIPWNLRLVHPGGYSSDITVALSADYYDIFEFQGMHPEPSEETSDGRYVYLTFAPPESGDVFAVSLDTYVQPASQIGRKADTAVIIDGHTVARVSYKTWLVP